MKQILTTTTLALSLFTFAKGVNAKLIIEDDKDQWHIVKVEEVIPLKSPGHYKLKYTTYCGEVRASGRVIKFVSGNELVLGVAVKKSGVVCVHANPQPETLRVIDKMDDPQNIKIFVVRISNNE